jgi:hypothetical protein|tara:strand:+ start:5960 stop:6628 length:669 start_codon:yes stop_codon:yes gene_type:complete
MAVNTKHVGALANTGTRCVVMMRQLPDDRDSALVIETESLPEWAHDDIIRMVDGDQAQATGNLWEVADRTVFTNGQNILAFAHQAGWLRKVPTSNVDMKPNSTTVIKLDELNKIIIEQTGDKDNALPKKQGIDVTGPATVQDNPEAQRRITTENVEQLANPTPPIPQASAPTDGALDDSALAANMLAQAKGYEAEAESLKAQAYEMDPSLKPTRGRPKKSAS